MLSIYCSKHVPVHRNLRLRIKDLQGMCCLGSLSRINSFKKSAKRNALHPIFSSSRVADTLTLPAEVQLIGDVYIRFRAALVPHHVALRLCAHDVPVRVRQVVVQIRRVGRQCQVQLAPVVRPRSKPAENDTRGLFLFFVQFNILQQVCLL